jgi:hypothetical protein
MGDRENRHQKKVQKINLKMRIDRKERVKELMEKRAGTFHLKDNKL